MEEFEEIKVFRVTLKKVISNLSELQNIDIAHFQERVEECFDGYNYEGEEELHGIDKWCDYTQNGEYELSVGIDHEDAYTFTIFITTKDGKVSVKNVL